jgi:hypothetical protein
MITMGAPKPTIMRPGRKLIVVTLSNELGRFKILVNGRLGFAGI